MAAILAKKLGMTQRFLEDGRVERVTVLEAGPCPVTAIRTLERDGYEAVQLAFGACKEKSLSKAELGHLKKADASAHRHLAEFRDEAGELSLGETITVDVFAAGDYEALEVTGAHRDHVIAFARRRGHDAAIVAVGRSLAPLSGAGRIWPGADAWQGSIVTTGYSVEDAETSDGASGLRLNSLFAQMPVAVRRATLKDASPTRRQRHGVFQPG